MNSSFSSSNTDHALSINDDKEEEQEKENNNQFSNNALKCSYPPSKNAFDKNLILFSKLATNFVGERELNNSDKGLLKSKPLDVTLLKQRSYNYQQNTRNNLNNTHSKTTIMMSSKQAYVNSNNLIHDKAPDIDRNSYKILNDQKEAEEMRRKRQEWYFLKLEEDYVNNAEVKLLFLLSID